MSALPTCVALRSKHDKTYLRCVYDESHGGSLVELGGDGAGVMNPRCRFYLEPSEEHEGLIHVRCCYNNKYWVPQHRVLPGHGGGTARWVIGTADEPEEDLSKPSCTLLKHVPIADGEAQDGPTCRFAHTKHIIRFLNALISFFLKSML
jgi:hypothetical protein